MEATDLGTIAQAVAIGVVQQWSACAPQLAEVFRRRRRIALGGGASLERWWLELTTLRQ